MADPEKQVVDGSDHEDVSRYSRYKVINIFFYLLSNFSEEEEAGAGAVDGRSAAASLLQDPNVMAALQVS